MMTFSYLEVQTALLNLNTMHDRHNNFYTVYPNVDHLKMKSFTKHTRCNNTVTIDQALTISLRHIAITLIWLFLLLKTKRCHNRVFSIISCDTFTLRHTTLVIDCVATCLTGDVSESKQNFS